MTDDFTQAEIVRSLQRIEDGMTRMKDEFQSVLAEMVRRDAWEQKNTALDRELKEVKEQHSADVADLKVKHEKDIGKLEARVVGLIEDLKRPPSWPPIVASVVAVAMAVISLIS